MIEFGFPAGFWLGLAGAGVLVAHLVRRRARRRTVPFLPLWAATLASRRGGIGAVLARRLDLLLVLLACGAVAAAAGAPFLRGAPETIHDLVLVLDGGISLSAGDREGRLRKVAAAEIRRRAPGTRYVVIGVTDTGPEVFCGKSRAQALAAVRAHRAGWTQASIKRALALARTAAQALRRPDLVFCTHRRLRPAGFRLRTLRVPVQNAGIESLAVVGDPEGGGRAVRLGLRGHGRVEIEGRWSGEVNGRRRITLPLPAEGRVDFALRSENDGFPFDDHAYLLLERRVRPRVLVVAAGTPSPFLIAALQALESTGAVAKPLEKTTPEHAARAAAAGEILIFDRCAPRERLDAVRALYIDPPSGTLPFRVGGTAPAPALFEIHKSPPILLGFDLGRVAPLRARGIFGGEVLASAAPGPVLAAAPGWIALGFDPDRCVFAASPAYPLFLRNSIQHLARSAPASQPEFYRLGEPSPVRGVARVEGCGSCKVAGRFMGPPGFWAIGPRTFAVNLLLPGLDLRSPDRPSDPLEAPGSPARPDRLLAPFFAAGALLILLLAWWLFWRKSAVFSTMRA